MRERLKSSIENILERLHLLSYASYIYRNFLANPDKSKFVRWWRFQKFMPFDQLPMPPMYMRWLVINQIDPAIFMESGRMQVNGLILPLLERNGLVISSFTSLLDFGCGCGRLIRYWKDLSDQDIWGCDYNSKMIKWCRKHLRFAQFIVNDLDPPLSFAPEKFDFIYARSIFTHLPEEKQLAWFREIFRVLKTDGVFLFTVSGDYYKSQLTFDEANIYDSGQMVIRKAGRAGQNDCAVFHPPLLVREILIRTDFELLEMVPGGTVKMAWQDTYLVRKK